MGNARRALALAGGALTVAALAVLGTLYATGAFASGEGREGARQERVAERGAELMPFDLEATTYA